MNEKINNYVKEQEVKAIECGTISDVLFKEYGVKRGLRDQNGKGVLAGLTRISKIISFKDTDEGHIPCDGELWYRGYNINSLIGELKADEFGFEKTAYLLLFGAKPTKSELEEFEEIVAQSRKLPTNFTRDVIMKASSKDVMNSMTRSILTLTSYDEDISSNNIDNCIRQCIKLISVFPMLAVYGYQAYNHYDLGKSLYIHSPKKELSTAENILRMLRPDKNYTRLEAKVLDVALMLHMEHGGGNNSTFTTRVVTSSGSDTYSSIAAAMSSLKGPKHGGANIKVSQMMSDIKKNVPDTEDENELRGYLAQMLDGQVFDKKGLIYGMGHAVYSVSDPREKVLKGYVKALAKEKQMDKQFALYESVEKLAPELIAEKRHIFKGVSPNVDFYSGFVYEMLGIPVELYTPLFAIARVVGWSAHRLEELVCANKIARPAYMSIMEEKE